MFKLHCIVNKGDAAMLTTFRMTFWEFSTRSMFRTINLLLYEFDVFSLIENVFVCTFDEVGSLRVGGISTWHDVFGRHIVDVGRCHAM